MGPRSTVGGVRLPFSSLRLLVPPLRLMSASLWQVAQQRDVQHYGRLEEFVTLVTEMVPELLRPRQRDQLILGLRAKLILELCRSVDVADPLTIQPHLDRFQLCTENPKHREGKDTEMEPSKCNFVELVQTLLKDPSEREHFFEVVFPEQYGSMFDTALQILVWEFFSRLEELLPVPSFSQTACYISLAPSDLEECDPDQLKTLLQHQRHQGHLTRDHVFFDCDTILSTLSLAYSVNSKQACVDSPRLCLDEDSCVAEGTKRHAGNRTEAEGRSSGVMEQEGEEDYEEEDYDEEDGEDIEKGLEKTGGSNLEQQELGSSPQTSSPSRPATVSGSSIDEPFQVFTCPQCPVSHRNIGKLQQHIRKQHQGKDRGTQDSGGTRSNLLLPLKGTFKGLRKKYICLECGKSFRSTSDLTRHHRVHTEEQPFPCNQCEKRFKSKESLKSHLRSHTGEKPYVCSYCGRGFRASNVLKSHVRTHTGEKPYACSLCGKRFVQPNSRAVHLRMHTGEKPYLCSVCGKSFYCLSGLLQHSRLHTGERPYQCQHCGKNFAKKVGLRMHERCHTGERPYPCTQCEKRFPTSCGLKRHLRTHTGEKPFQCVKCGKRFSERSNMKIHQRSHNR